MIAGGITHPQLRAQQLRAVARRRIAERKAQEHFAELLATVSERCAHDDLHAGTCSKCGARRG